MATKYVGNIEEEFEISSEIISTLRPPISAIRLVSHVSEMSIERSFRWHVLFNTNLFSPSLGTMFFYLFSLCVKKHASNKCRHICSMANIIILIASIETQNCQQKETMSSALSQTIFILFFQHHLKIIPFINYIWSTES